MCITHFGDILSETVGASANNTVWEYEHIMQKNMSPANCRDKRMESAYTYIVWVVATLQQGRCPSQNKPLKLLTVPLKSVSQKWWQYITPALISEMQFLKY